MAILWFQLFSMILLVSLHRSKQNCDNVYIASDRQEVHPDELFTVICTGCTPLIIRDSTSLNTSEMAGEKEVKTISMKRRYRQFGEYLFRCSSSQTNNSKEIVIKVLPRAEECDNVYLATDRQEIQTGEYISVLCTGCKVLTLTIMEKDHIRGYDLNQRVRRTMRTILQEVQFHRPGQVMIRCSSAQTDNYKEVRVNVHQSNNHTILSLDQSKQNCDNVYIASDRQEVYEGELFTVICTGCTTLNLTGGKSSNYYMMAGETEVQTVSMKRRISYSGDFVFLCSSSQTDESKELRVKVLPNNSSRGVECNKVYLAVDRKKVQTGEYISMLCTGCTKLEIIISDEDYITRYVLKQEAETEMRTISEKVWFYLPRPAYVFCTSPKAKYIEQIYVKVLQSNNHSIRGVNHDRRRHIMKAKRIPSIP